MPHVEPDRIRNVALVGHRASGKTSLTEALLFEAGAINRLGSVDDGTTVSDHAPDERARGMSIAAGVASCRWQDRKVNLIDTPGDPSFVADALAALAVCEGAVFVVNAVAGVEVGTQRMWERAEELGLSRLLFVNMLDRERADFFAALDALKTAFGPHVVATEIPLGAEHELEGVIDLIDMKAFRARGTGRGSPEEIEIPAELRAQAEEYRDKLMDEVAEVSDELMEHYLEGDEISHEETVTALKSGVTARHDLPRDLRRRHAQPRHHAAAERTHRGPALARAAGAGGGRRRPARAGGRPRHGRAGVQDAGRPVRRAGSTCSASTAACSATTARRSTAAPTIGSGSASCWRPRAGTTSTPTSSARATSAAWPSSSTPRPVTCCPAPTASWRWGCRGCPGR